MKKILLIFFVLIVGFLFIGGVFAATVSGGRYVLSGGQSYSGGNSSSPDYNLSTIQAIPRISYKSISLFLYFYKSLSYLVMVNPGYLLDNI